MLHQPLLLHSKPTLLHQLPKHLQPMLHLRQLQPQRLLLLVLRSHRAWVQVVVQFRHLRVAVVQLLLLLVVRVELLVQVVLL